MQPRQPDDAESDESLAARLRAGDSAAGEVLIARFNRPLMGYLRRLAGGEHAAEELHQATWLSVLEHLDRFEPSAGGGFKAWLFRIATNKAHDWWRSRGRERTAKEGLRLVRDEAFYDASPAEADETTARVLAAVEKLPEPQRQVLLLRYYGGMKFAEIAEMLGCPLNTALGRMHKATLKLRELLRDLEPADV